MITRQKLSVDYRVHISWQDIIISIFESYPNEVETLKQELSTSIFTPAKENIFKAFSLPKSGTKAIILGQDPYPNPQHAIGLAFAIPDNASKSYSLRVIEKEIGKENIDMKTWHNQGVLLLNTALTCEVNNPGSHLNKWEFFTQEIIKHISKLDQPIVWLLWGNHAKKIYKNNALDNNHHLILSHSHPAAQRFGKPFAGCEHFIKANTFLSDNSLSEIVW